jgi:hypothetical protein
MYMSKIQDASFRAGWGGYTRMKKVLFNMSKNIGRKTRGGVVASIKDANTYIMTNGKEIGRTELK